MRARPLDADAAVPITFDGREIAARRGETLAAALAAAGVTAFRVTRTSAWRGIFCGMGVCQDCLVEVDGRPNRRACMTKVERPLTARTQTFPPRLAPEPRRRPGPAPGDPDLLVVGAGAGGLTAAAVAAEAGASVLLLDERPAPGGQYHKQPLGPFADDPQFAAGRRLIARAGAAGVRALRGTVWSASRGPFELGVLFDDEGTGRTLRPRRLVVATGAYERAVPLPGWTLPGVMTTGAAQTLLRSYGVLPGRRVVIAGNGPLNLQVARELLAAGARVLAVAELAPPPGPGSLGTLTRMAASAPGLVAKGASHLAALRRAGVPVLHGRVLRSVEERPGGLLARFGPTDAAYEADAVAMGYGFMPANEILRLLGCRHDYDPARGHLVTVRDGGCRTTVPDVLAVGDCCGLGGAPAAEAEGAIAGLAAAEGSGHPPSPALERERARARRDLARHRRFQKALWRLFEARHPACNLATADTVICRCEEVTLAEVETALADGHDVLGTLKRRTRLGMGRCQGRYCAPVLAALLHERHGRPLDELAFMAPRPAIKPVPIGALVGTEG